jgi:DNA-binding response OmpR family regulator
MPAINPTDLTALVIDDHAILRDMVVQNLRKMGFENIDTAGTSNEAAALMAKKIYDIIFIDWVMPGKSGYALMQECRQDRQYDRVAFVMVTAQPEERLMVEAMKAGATAYIVKPELPKPFQEKVKGVLEWIERVNARAQQSGG